MALTIIPFTIPRIASIKYIFSIANSTTLNTMIIYILMHILISQKLYNKRVKESSGEIKL